MPPIESSSSQPLVEGVDYVVEGGRWVFLAAYLLRRGVCCGNACRHCPFGHENVVRPRVEDAGDS